MSTGAAGGEKVVYAKFSSRREIDLVILLGGWRVKGKMKERLQREQEGRGVGGDGIRWTIASTQPASTLEILMWDVLMVSRSA